jgi:thiamine biosynthesis lipoprotein ApbE
VPRLTPAPDQPSAVAGALGEDDWSELELEALGTWGRVAVRGGGPGLLIDARQRLDDLDRLWDPSRPDSLVAQIEAAPGTPVPVDDTTFALVEASLAAAEATGGVVGSSGIQLNAMVTRVTLDADGVLDVDDLARAQAVDLVAEGLVESGAVGAVVELGGTRRLAGSPGTDRAWVVDIGDPDDHQAVLATLGLAEGAAVTVDRPTAAVLSVTVLAPDAASAAILAAEGDPGRVAGSGFPALVVHDDRTVDHLGGLEDFLRADG